MVIIQKFRSGKRWFDQGNGTYKNQNHDDIMINRILRSEWDGFYFRI